MKRVVVASIILALGSTWALAYAGQHHHAKAANTKRGPRGLRGHTGPQGPQGPQGLPGASGAQGPAGIMTVKRFDGPTQNQCPDGTGACQVAASNADCPAGWRAIAGGFVTSSVSDSISYSALVANGWGVIGTNYSTSGETIQANVVCATGPGIAAARTAGSAGDGEFERVAETLRASLR